MSDFSLTTLFVVPVGQTTLPNSGSTQDLTAGQVGVFINPTHVTANAGNIAAATSFYIAQGRTNTYLLGSKKSDKIKGCSSGYPCKSNVKEWYKVGACPGPTVQITELSAWSVKCGEDVSVSLRLHSSYIDSLYFNGLTRSVTVKAPCCECGGDPCTDVDVPTLIDLIIAAFETHAPGINSDNLILTNFLTFTRIGAGSTAVLRITGKALTVYGQPCDVAAFPHEYDRMRFNVWAIEGPDTTADFIVSDACNIIATATIIQNANYMSGTSAEIKQLEKNYYSYQAGYLKHLYRMAGWNENFESWVTDGSAYDTYYIKFNELDQDNVWGDYVKEDEMVIIAALSGGAFATALETVLEAALGSVEVDNECITTTTTTTAAATTTTTTTAAEVTTTTTTTEEVIG